MTDKKITSFVQKGDTEDLFGELDFTKQLPPRIPNLGCAVMTAADEKPTYGECVDLRNRTIMS